jgi:hypothetical protein
MGNSFAGKGEISRAREINTKEGAGKGLILLAPARRRSVLFPAAALRSGPALSKRTVPGSGILFNVVKGADGGGQSKEKEDKVHARSWGCGGRWPEKVKMV